MMDLLIQVTTAHKINPGGHVIQVMNVRSDDYLYYKPSTPIGNQRLICIDGFICSTVRRESISTDLISVMKL